MEGLCSGTVRFAISDSTRQIGTCIPNPGIRTAFTAAVPSGEPKQILKDTQTRALSLDPAVRIDTAGKKKSNTIIDW